MAQSASIQRVSIRHDTLMDFLLANPTMPLGIVAAHFRVTQPWLSCIIHSDVFQAKLREKQAMLFGATVLPLREKLLGLAHTAVDKMGEHLDKTDDPDYVKEVGMALLDRVGFNPKALPAAGGVATNIQNNYYQVDRATLQEARSAIGRRVREMEERELAASAPPAQLPTGERTGMGELV